MKISTPQLYLASCFNVASLQLHLAKYFNGNEIFQCAWIYGKCTNKKASEKKKHLRHALKSVRQNVSMEIEYSIRLENRNQIVRGLFLMFAERPTTIKKPEN